MSFYVMGESTFQLTYDGETVSYGPPVDESFAGGPEDETPEPPEEV